MKKVIFFTTLFLFLFPKFSLAQNTTTPDASVEVRIRNNVNSTKPVNQEIRQKIEARGENITLKLNAAKRERIRNYFARAVTRIEALIERLNSLISRMETRIDKIKETGSDIDTEIAEQDIVDAKVLMEDAINNLSKAKSNLETAISSDNPLDSFKPIIESVQEIKTQLKDVHKLLVHAIGEIKGLRVGDDNEK